MQWLVTRGEDIWWPGSFLLNIIACGVACSNYKVVNIWHYQEQKTIEGRIYRTQMVQLKQIIIHSLERTIKHAIMMGI